MLLLAGILSCSLQASLPDTVTRFGEVRFHPGFEARKDSFVSLAPIQSVGFRGVRWTARDFYIHIAQGGRDLSIQWLDPIPGEGRQVVDTVYGPVSWRQGRLTTDLSLRASNHTPLLVQLDSATSVDSSWGWLEARNLVLGRDSTVSIEQDTIWLRLRSGLSLKAEKFLLRGPLRWKGAFPRTRIPFPNGTSALRIDSLWLAGNRLEARDVRHTPSFGLPRKFSWVALSLDRRIQQTRLEAVGRWDLTHDMALAWKGVADVADGIPRLAEPFLIARRPDGNGRLPGWCDPAGGPLQTDSVKIVPVSQTEFVTDRMLHRCDDQGLVWKGIVRLGWNGRLDDGPLWTWRFEPKGIGIAGLLDASDHPVHAFDSSVRDSFQAGGIEGLLRAIPRHRLHKIRSRSLPLVEFVPDDTSWSGHLRFPDGSRARILSGSRASACPGGDTFPVTPIPALLERSGACLEREGRVGSISFANTSGWGSFLPDRFWKLEPRGTGYRIRGKWLLSKALRRQLGSDSLPLEVQASPTDERFSAALPDANWSASFQWQIPVERMTGWGWEDLPGNSSLTGTFYSSRMLVTYEAPPDGPRIFKRLEAPYPASWKGRRVGLVSARFQLGADGRITDTNLVWSTVERFDRQEHPWGWVYQFDRPASARFQQKGPLEILQDPTYWSRMSLPQDGNPNPVAKGLPKPLTPPLSAHSEPTLPFSALPAPPTRQGRAPMRLDSAGTLAVDRLMATVTQYDSCVAARACTPVKRQSPTDTGSIRAWHRRALWPESVQSGLDFPQAQAYCAFRGAKLPTQLQWRQILRQSLGPFEVPRRIHGFAEREHLSGGWPQVPGQLSPWKSGLFDLLGNGPIWCMDGAACRNPRDSLRTLPVSERESVGVRCVE